jgi:hypothetical protein
VRVVMPTDCTNCTTVCVYPPDDSRLMTETCNYDYSCKIKLVGRFTAFMCKYTQARRNIINKYSATVLLDTSLLAPCFILPISLKATGTVCRNFYLF